MGPSKLRRLGGLRLTLPRLKVFELFQVHDRLTPREAYQLLDRTETALGLATVHRVLAELCEAGMLERHYLARGMASFTLPHTGVQAHLVCQRCGQVQACEDPQLQELVHRLTSLHEFEVMESTVSLRGLCAECKDRRRPSFKGREPSR